MTNKLYQRLTEANVIDNQIKEIDLQLEKLYAMFLPGAIRYDKDKVQTSPSDNMMPNTFDKIEELKADRRVLEERYITAMTSVRNLISKVSDCQTRLVLMHRYIDNIPWSEIPDKMHYSREWCFKKHRDGIEELESLIQ